MKQTASHRQDDLQRSKPISAVVLQWKAEVNATRGFKFKSRNNFVYRRRTTGAQKPPDEYRPKIVSFVRYIRRLGQQHEHANVRHHRL